VHCEDYLVALLDWIVDREVARDIIGSIVGVHVIHTGFASERGDLSLLGSSTHLMLHLFLSGRFLLFLELAESFFGLRGAFVLLLLRLILSFHLIEKLLLFTFVNKLDGIFHVDQGEVIDVLLGVHVFKLVLTDNIICLAVDHTLVEEHKLAILGGCLIPIVCRLKHTLSWGEALGSETTHAHFRWL
jgi:hypothetical protein